MFVIKKTHVGMVRTVNEDALLSEGPKLFAVADGMGGYAAGETASSEALKVLKNEIDNQIIDENNVKNILTMAIQKANEHVRALAETNEEYHDMGTTLVAVYLQSPSKAYIANVGDSRLYLWRDGFLTQITKDHSYVAELLKNGEITENEAFQHPKRNIILRAIGAEAKLDADIFELNLTTQDKILLCSDGLTDMVEDTEIKQILENNQTESAGEILLESALNNGGRDNVSLILIDFADTEEEK